MAMTSISPLSFLSTVSDSSRSTASVKYEKPKRHRIPRVACSGNQNTSKVPHIAGHRRYVLTGLGGLCGAVTLNINPFAFPVPVFPLDLTTCRPSALKAKPTQPKFRVQKVAPYFGVGAAQAVETSSNAKFPLVLDSVVSTLVNRPKKASSKKEREEEEEVLVIEGIEFNGRAVKFDVIIDGDYKLIGPGNTEFAGSFVSMPRLRKQVNTRLKLGLTDLLEDLGADDDDSVVVTLVPRYGLVKIRGIKIELQAD